MVDTKNVHVNRTVDTPDELTLVSGVTMWLTSHPERLSIPAKLIYSSTDPYAVTMEFVVPDGTQVAWRFARDLILDGLYGPAGLGDIRLFPAGQFVILDLCSPDGSARLATRAAELREFTDETMKAVAIGEESRHFVIDDNPISVIAGTVGGGEDHAPAI